MSQGLQRLSVAGMVLIAAYAYAKTNTSSSLEDTDVHEAFRLGESCAGLAFLSKEQLERSLDLSFPEDHKALCYPEEPFECSDYTPYLHGLGFLDQGEDQYHCQWIAKS